MNCLSDTLRPRHLGAFAKVAMVQHKLTLKRELTTMSFQKRLWGTRLSRHYEVKIQQSINDI